MLLGRVSSSAGVRIYLLFLYSSIIFYSFSYVKIDVVFLDLLQFS